MGRIEKTILIKASSDRIWEMLAFDRILEWQLGFEKAKSVEYKSEVNVPKDKYRVGATAYGIPKKQGEPIRFNFEIVESVEYKKITTLVYEKMFGGTLIVLTTYTLEPLDKETKFTYEGEYKMPWGIFGKFIEKMFIGRWVEKMLGEELENLKNLLEK